jgi:hypothetical protein
MENMTVLFFFTLVPGVLASLFIQPSFMGLISTMGHSGVRIVARFLALFHYLCALTLMWFNVPEAPLGVSKHEHIINDFLSAFFVLRGMPHFWPTLLTLAYLGFLGTHYARLSQWLTTEIARKGRLKRSIREGIRTFSSSSKHA